MPLNPHLDERHSPKKTSFKARTGNTLVLFWPFTKCGREQVSFSATCSVNLCSNSLSCWSDNSIGSSLAWQPDIVTRILCRHFHLHRKNSVQPAQKKQCTQGKKNSSSRWQNHWMRHRCLSQSWSTILSINLLSISLDNISNSRQEV